MLMPPHIHAPHRQHGATLIVALIILVLITVIGLSTTNVTTTDIKIVANSKDRQLAFIGAETELQDAGEAIHQTDGRLTDDVDAYVGDEHSGDTDWWQDHTNWSASTSNSSEYIIQEPTVRREAAKNNVTNLTMGATGPTTMHGFYPTTAKSYGPGNAFVLLQCHFIKRLYDNIAN